MEYALRGCHGSDIENQESAVLILVLMEYALREMNLLDVFGGYVTSLNPCFNGICSARRNAQTELAHQNWRLNPCFNGICSARLLLETFTSAALQS